MFTEIMPQPLHYYPILTYVIKESEASYIYISSLPMFLESGSSHHNIMAKMNAILDKWCTSDIYLTAWQTENARFGKQSFPGFPPDLLLVQKSQGRKGLKIMAFLCLGKWFEIPIWSFNVFLLSPSQLEPVAKAPGLWSIDHI